MMRRWWLLMMALLIVGCGDATESTPRPSVPTVSPTTVTVAPTLTTQQRFEYETQYEALRQSQQIIETIWRDLQTGREVSCAADIPQAIKPANITGSDAIGQALFKAASDVNEAIVLWRAECENPRAVPPAPVIDEGLGSALAAAQTLKKIEQDLAR